MGKKIRFDDLVPLWTPFSKTFLLWFLLENSGASSLSSRTRARFQRDHSSSSVTIIIVISLPLWVLCCSVVFLELMLCPFYKIRIRENDLTNLSYICFTLFLFWVSLASIFSHWLLCFLSEKPWSTSWFVSTRYLFWHFYIKIEDGVLLETKFWQV